MKSIETSIFRNMAVAAGVLGLLACEQTKEHDAGSYEAPAQSLKVEAVEVDFTGLDGPTVTDWEACPRGDVAPPAIIRVNTTNTGKLDNSRYVELDHLQIYVDHEDGSTLGWCGESVGDYADWYIDGPPRGTITLIPNCGKEPECYPRQEYNPLELDVPNPPMEIIES